MSGNNQTLAGTKGPPTKNCATTGQTNRVSIKIYYLDFIPSQMKLQKIKRSLFEITPFYSWPHFSYFTNFLPNLHSFLLSLGCYEALSQASPVICFATKSPPEETSHRNTRKPMNGALHTNTGISCRWTLNNIHLVFKDQKKII